MNGYDPKNKKVKLAARPFNAVVPPRAFESGAVTPTAAQQRSAPHHDGEREVLEEFSTGMGDRVVGIEWGGQATKHVGVSAPHLLYVAWPLVWFACIVVVLDPFLHTTSPSHLLPRGGR